MAKIIKLQAKQAVNSGLYYYNRLNITSVYNLLFNSKVLIWRKSGNQTRPYRLLAVENETYYIQLFSGLTSFRNTSVKPYFQSENTYNIKLDKLEVLTKLGESKAPTKLNKLKVFTELDKLKMPLFTLEVPQNPTALTEPAIKRG